MLTDKKAVITGASSGIGRTIALQMAKNGADIALVYASDEEGAQSAIKEANSYGRKAIGYFCDVSNAEQSKKTCEKIAADFGGMDILVNNAGIIRDSLILRMSEADYDFVLDINLKGAFLFVKYLARYLMKSSCGRIINISSISGLVGNIGQANYSASKAGLIGLTKTIAKEFASRQITCNAIAPGLIDTKMAASMDKSAAEAMLAAVPLKRIGKPEDVASLVLFLVSDAASYITGEVIRVDGGMCI